MQENDTYIEQALDEVEKIAPSEPAAPKPANGFMSRSDILKTPKREYRVVDVSRWWGPGATVRLQSLTAGERDSWEASYVTQDKKGAQKVNTQTIRAGLVVRSLVDAEGRLLFTPGEVTVLQEMHAGAIDAMYAVAGAMNGITDKDVEELEGNSGRGPTAAPSSQSQ